MNIILRPGGGDKSRALPRPKVDVRADGPNVIIVRMTFPDNENIQGLRAFTPTEPEAISQFSAINEILPPNTSVERITASEEVTEAPQVEAENTEYEYYDDYEIEPQNRTERQPQPQPQNTAEVVTQPPTRPPRPPRLPQGVPPQPGVLLGLHPKVPPPPHFKPQIPQPPRPEGQKAPRLYIQSSLSAGNKNFDYNVQIDRQDWRPLPSPNFHPKYHY